MENKQSNSNLLIGFILGFAAALLFSTKKGRRILSVITDKGFSKFEDWEEVVREIIDGIAEEEDYIKGDDYVPAAASTGMTLDRDETGKQLVVAAEDTEGKTLEAQEKAKVVENTAGGQPGKDTGPQESKQEQEDTVAKVKSTARRFFRGIKK